MPSKAIVYKKAAFLYIGLAQLKTNEAKQVKLLVPVRNWILFIFYSLAELNLPTQNSLKADHRKIS